MQDRRSAARESARIAVASSVAVALRASRAPLGFAVLYHRVDEHAEDPARHIVPALARTLFEAQLRHLARFYRPVRASELLTAIQRRRRGAPIPVAVTFDDDLDTHVRVAAPALAAAAVPATFFLSGQDGRRWWDDLQLAVDQSVVDAGGLGPALAPRLADALAGAPWALHAVAGEIVELAPSERAAAAAALRAAVAPLCQRPTPALEQARALSDQGFEIGFHTRDHEPLDTLDEAALTAAMTDGRTVLEDAIGHRALAIAYPHGRADERVVAAAARGGFEAGFTTESKAIGPVAARLRLGRIAPAHSSLGAFALTIARSLVVAARR